MSVVWTGLAFNQVSLCRETVQAHSVAVQLAPGLQQGVDDRGLGLAELDREGEGGGRGDGQGGGACGKQKTLYNSGWGLVFFRVHVTGFYGEK